jgi:uncharacterized RDD family membrane protein YckC
VSQLELGTSYAVRESRERVSPYNDIDVMVLTRRVVGGLVDWALLASVFILFARSFGMMSQHFAWQFSVPAKYSFVPHHFALSVWYPHLGPTVVFAFICLAYFTLFEGTFGWTPGKRAVGICVVDFFGGRPTLTQALVRNLFRFFDAYPFVVPYLVGLGILVTNSRRQRGGDKAAGTLVVDRRSYRVAKVLLRQTAMADREQEQMSPEAAFTLRLGPDSATETSP